MPSRLPDEIPNLIATLDVSLRASRGGNFLHFIHESQPSFDTYLTPDHTWQHTITFKVPADAFYDIVPQRTELETLIADGLNELNTFDDEHIAAVAIRCDAGSMTSLDTGTTAQNTQSSSDPQLEPLHDWGNGLKLFISHTHSVASTAHEIAEELRWYGISPFVAHDDIEPTEEWIRVLHYALDTTEAMLTLHTDDFISSNWTQQEVGWASGRRVFFIPVHMGAVPVGFISSKQAMKYTSIYELRGVVLDKLSNQFNMSGHFVDAVSPTTSFKHNDILADLLSENHELTDNEAQILVEKFNSEPDGGPWRKINQIHGSKFSQGDPNVDRFNIVNLLNRATTESFGFDELKTNIFRLR